MRLSKLTFLFLPLSLCLSNPMVSQIQKTYVLDIGNFDEIKIKNGINVNYINSTDSIGTAEFASDSETADAIVFENKKGKLTVSLIPRTFGREHKIPTVTVRSNSLLSVINEGDSLVRVINPAPVPKFSARLTGNGVLSIRNINTVDLDISIKFGNGVLSIDGQSKNVLIKNTGTGSIQCGLLKADNVKCNLIGTGNIDCTVNEGLVITGMGSGTVYYSGELKEIRNRGVGIKTVAVDTRN